jgi:hypothetical protein
MNCQLFTAQEIADFKLELECVEEDDGDTIEDIVIPMSQELKEEEWEFQNSDKWIAEYEALQVDKNLAVIEHWFYLEEDGIPTRIRGIHKDSGQIITTSPVVQVLEGVLYTQTGSKYRLVNQINGEGVDDICKYWPQFQGC